jgi:serine/threonine protein kinase
MMQVSAHKALNPGAEVDGYRIERALRPGGMGTVYVARHPRFALPVALKLLRPAYSDETEYRDRFQLEALQASQLAHENIVRVYDQGEFGGLLYIAMQYVEGEDASEHLPMSPARAAWVVREAGKGLDYLHRQGIIHRDVKPQNIILSSGADGREIVKLTDFGIAKPLAGPSLTTIGMIVATVHYASPEQLRGQQDLDGRVDVYSLGCTLFHLLAGHPPFPYAQQAAVVAAHLSEEAPRISDIRPDVPVGFDAVIARAMAKERSDRYPTCGELGAAAMAAAQPKPAPLPPPPGPGPHGWQPAGPGAPAGPAPFYSAPGPPQPQPQPPFPRPPRLPRPPRSGARSHPVLLGTVIVLAVLVVIVGVMLAVAV